MSTIGRRRILATKATDNNNPLLAPGLAYAQRGWPVLPLHSPKGQACSCRNPDCRHVGKHPRTLHGVKDATTDAATIRTWWAKWPDANIGIATGSISGLMVLDVDPRHGGLESLRRLQDQPGPLPRGPAVLTGGDGYHYYFLAPDFRVRNKVGLADGIDVRGDGAYIIAPPSRHATGQIYRWAEGLDPDSITLPPLPDWLRTLLVAHPRENGNGDRESSHVPEGSRNSHLTSLAGTMRQRGMSEAAIFAALRIESLKRCDPPLTEEEVRAIAVSVARYPAGPTITTDLGLVKRLADRIIVTERFAKDQGGKLYRFSDGVYKPNGSGHIKLLVKRLLEEWNLTKKWSSARSDEVVEYINVDARHLWEHPPLSPVNIQNGLLDVEAGRLLPHSPEHLSPIQLPVAYDAAATCPEWETFVEQVFPIDAQELAWQIIAWLMRPDVSIQKAILLLGEGGNGKSTYLTGVTNFVGHRNVSAVNLHRLESDRFSVARLIGKLANICPDLPSSHLAGTSTFKALTGGDRLLAEYKYEDSFEFSPFARLVFSANLVPRSSDSSHAFFRRWLVALFTRTFEEGEAIPRPEMDARLANARELSGVLNKALLALRQMQEQGGLIESESMVAAGDEFRKATDPLSVWLDGWTIEQSDSFVMKKALLSAYNSAAQAEGRPAMTATAFGLALRRLRPNFQDGQRTVAGKVEWVWLGLGLRSSEQA